MSRTSLPKGKISAKTSVDDGTDHDVDEKAVAGKVPRLDPKKITHVTDPTGNQLSDVKVPNSAVTASRKQPVFHQNDFFVGQGKGNKAITIEELYRYKTSGGPTIRIAVIDVRNSAPSKDGIQTSADKQLPMALHFPMNEGGGLVPPAVANAHYATDYPFKNVATVDLVVFHCDSSANRGPAAASQYRIELEAGRLHPSYNKKQQVALLTRGFNEVEQRATGKSGTKIDGLMGYLTSWSKNEPHTVEEYKTMRTTLAQTDFSSRFI